MDFVFDIHAHNSLHGAFIYGNSYDDVYRCSLGSQITVITLYTQHSKLKLTVSRQVREAHCVPEVARPERRGLQLAGHNVQPRPKEGGDSSTVRASRRNGWSGLTLISYWKLWRELDWKRSAFQFANKVRESCTVPSPLLAWYTRGRPGGCLVRWGEEDEVAKREGRGGGSTRLAQLGRPARSSPRYVEHKHKRRTCVA